MYQGVSASTLARQLKEKLSDGQYLSLMYLIATGLNRDQAIAMNVNCKDDEITDLLYALIAQGDPRDK